MARLCTRVTTRHRDGSTVVHFCRRYDLLPTMMTSLFLHYALACSGSQERSIWIRRPSANGNPEEVAIEISPLSQDAVSTWTVRLADDTARYPFETDGWGSYAKGLCSCGVILRRASLARVHLGCPICIAKHCSCMRILLFICGEKLSATRR